MRHAGEYVESLCELQLHALIECRDEGGAEHGGPLSRGIGNHRIGGVVRIAVDERGGGGQAEIKRTVNAI